MSDINDILQQIKKTKKTISVFVPSIQQEVEIAPVTLAQQSKIIESVSDNTNIANNPILALLEFNSIMFNILRSNIVEYQPIYNTIDRVSFVLALKGHIDNVVVEDDTEFNISKIIERNLSIEYTAQPETIVSENMSFEVAPPSLEDDNLINNLILRKYKSNNTLNKSLLSDVYTFEALKFIKSITIDETTVQIKNDSKSLEAIKQIDTSILNPVFDYITNVRNIEEQYTKHPTTDSVIQLTPDIFIS